MDIFVQKMRQAMFSKGIKQVDLVRLTGYSDGQISSWYNGRYRPNAAATAKIAKALGVTPGWLLGQEEMNTSKLTLPEVHEVDVLGKVAAGYPMIAQEDVIGTIYTDKNVFALKIKGDSMSPRIMDGDIVLVQSQSFAEDGDLVIAMIEGEATCKVFKKNHGVVTLVPFNAAYAPMVYTKTDADSFRIIGKVVESRHEW